jgi:hypothetical protein
MKAGGKKLSPTFLEFEIYLALFPCEAGEELEMGD